MPEDKQAPCEKSASPAKAEDSAPKSLPRREPLPATPPSPPAQLGAELAAAGSVEERGAIAEAPESDAFPDFDSPDFSSFESHRDGPRDGAQETEFGQAGWLALLIEEAVDRLVTGELEVLPKSRMGAGLDGWVFERLWRTGVILGRTYGKSPGPVRVHSEAEGAYVQSLRFQLAVAVSLLAERDGGRRSGLRELSDAPPDALSGATTDDRLTLLPDVPADELSTDLSSELPNDPSGELSKDPSDEHSNDLSCELRSELSLALPTLLAATTGVPRLLLPLLEHWENGGGKDDSERKTLVSLLASTLHRNAYLEGNPPDGLPLHTVLAVIEARSFIRLALATLEGRARRVGEGESAEAEGGEPRVAESRAGDLKVGASKLGDSKLGGSRTLESRGVFKDAPERESSVSVSFFAQSLLRRSETHLLRQSQLKAGAVELIAALRHSEGGLSERELIIARQQVRGLKLNPVDRKRALAALEAPHEVEELLADLPPRLKQQAIEQAALVLAVKLPQAAAFREQAALLEQAGFLEGASSREDAALSDGAALRGQPDKLSQDHCVTAGRSARVSSEEPRTSTLRREQKAPTDPGEQGGSEGLEGGAGEQDSEQGSQLQAEGENTSPGGALVLASDSQARERMPWLNALSGPLRSMSFASISASLEEAGRALAVEMRETAELGRLLSRAAMGEVLDDEERGKVKEQLLDLAKAVPALAILAAPGGTLLLPILLRILPFDLRPSAFRKEEGPSSEE